MSLLDAAEKGDAKRVKALLDKGVHPDDEKSADDWTSLLRASFNGHRDCMQLLISQKADPNHQSKIGWTSLMWASQEGHLDCVQLLLSRKADPNHQDKVRGKTARYFAQSNSHKEIVALLDRKRIADLRVKESASQAVRQWCRLFATPDPFVGKSTGEQKMLLEFFVERPGLRRLIGGSLVRFYNPLTTDTFGNESWFTLRPLLLFLKGHLLGT